MNLEVLQAFALTDDHTQQETVWSSLPAWNRTAMAVRQWLSKDDIPATDKRVRFVGLAPYEREGGPVRRDLFADDEQGVWLTDPATLNRLVAEKLDHLADHVKAEGWKWVEAQPATDYTALSKFTRIPAERSVLSPKDEAKLVKLKEKLATLESRLSEDEEDEANNPIYDRIEKVRTAIADVERSRKEVYAESIRAQCGVVISVDYDGKPEFRYGLMRKEEEKRLRQSPPKGKPDGVPVNEPEAEDVQPYSAPLVDSLTQYKTAALALELAPQPQLALSAVVHALVLDQFRLDLHLYRSQTCLHLATTQPYLPDAQESPASQALEQDRNDWLSQLPRTAAALWTWCLDQEQDTLLRLLAFCAAKSINAVRKKSDGEQDHELLHAETLAAALNLDMAQWFTPHSREFL